MIETCLAELYTVLPDPELLRIQKTLKIILSRGLDAERLRRVVREGYARLGRPFEIMERMGVADAFGKLLDGFGMLSVEQMTAAEKADLQKSPYTIWPDERRCVVSGEAFELLAGEPAFRKRNYLYGELSRLPVKERRAWFRWLGLDCPVRSEKDRCHQIYMHLAAVRRQPRGPALPDRARLPEFLDEVFPNDPLQSPVAWFYRDILPLYQALHDAEKQLRADRNSRARELKLDIIELFKNGHVVARAIAPEFGEATRYRLTWTRESTPTRVCAEALPQSVPSERIQDETRQEVLF